MGDVVRNIAVALSRPRALLFRQWVDATSSAEVQPMNGTPERPKTATSQGSADHNGASFWEEVQRRRREERQRRQSTSEVQQLLQEVRKERRANPESVQSPTSGSEATGPGSENRAYSFSPPRQASEVEKILAEIRQERCKASPASARPARPAPKKAQRVRPKNPQPNPVDSLPRPRKASPVRKQLFKDVSKTEHSQQSQQFSMTRTSSSSTSRRESPSRLLELGCLGKGCTGSWSAQLRSYLPSGTQDEPEADDRFVKTAVQAYPAGGWDSRTSCPRFFDNFPGGVIKRNPNETLPRARSLPRLKASRSRSTSPVSPRQTPENTTELRFKELLKDAQNAVLRATEEAALPSKEEVTEVTEISEVVPVDVTTAE